MSVFVGPTNVTYGSGTVKVQCSPDGGTTWHDLPSGSFTSGTGLKSTYTVFGTHVRLNLAGATNPNIDLQIALYASQSLGEVEKGTIANGETSSDIQLEKAADKIALFASGTFSSTVVHLKATIDGGTKYQSLGSLSATNMLVVTANSLIHRVRVDAVGGTGTGLAWHVFA